MKIEIFMLSLTCHLTMIVRSGVAIKTVSMASPFANDTIESGRGDARAS